MFRNSFNAGWTVRPKVNIFSQLNDAPDSRVPVTLPHDAMLMLPRAAEHTGGPQSGYFPGGAVEYSKTFTVPDEWRERAVSLEFQGVYRDAMVYVNGTFAAQRPNGYTVFNVRLDPYLRYGEENTIIVEARVHQDSRWYSGLGIHRDTVLSVTGLAHLPATGARVTTPDVDGERAVVEVATPVENEGRSTRTFAVHTRLVDATGEEAASAASPITLKGGESGVVRQRLYIRQPELWSVERPYLYRAETQLRNGEELSDARTTTFGIRTLQLDPLHGLRINGEVVKLRGACIHSDNGILGAAAIGRAEERRIEILKEAGFNAVRSAHNPMSPAMLDACDRLGMLVMDETFDMWTLSKNNFDYSLSFPEWWERDVESLIAKDFNHPSVIIYSIGNEVLDAGTGQGAPWGRKLAEKVRSLDETRFVTNAISGFVATITDLLPRFKEQAGELRGQVGANDLLGEMHHLFDQISLSDEVTQKTAESHSAVDIVGHNYAHSRYLGDQAAFPDRVVVGTETLAKEIDEIWALVTEHPHVLGDFTWTGWDYLGEAGLGSTRYVGEDGTEPAYAPYPWLLAWCGDIDITGYRRPASYYREIVFGLRSEPYLAVQRPQHYGQDARTLGWSWSDSVGSWDWRLPAGGRVKVEVYSASDEVELLLNGRSLGAAPTGPVNRFRAEFDLEYEPGELIAIGRNGGVEVGRTALRSSSGPARLAVQADRDLIRADDNDLAFVTIELRDDHGTLITGDDRPVRVTVSGPAVLQGLGTARPVTEERFDSDTTTTFEGRALAVLRPTGAGDITVIVSAESLDDSAVAVRAR